MRDSAKLGRNSSCSCGSGKKYKKCCLMANKKNQTLIDASMDQLKNGSSDNTVFVSPGEFGVRKMSEIILEYAEEFLELPLCQDSCRL
jgi:SEC-C motif